MNNLTIKPIETAYNGYRFHSRLEARWAIFWDALSIRYEYEPQGFQVAGKSWLNESGVLEDESWNHLPDFYLPDFRTWVEVKGRAASAAGDAATGDGR